MKLVVSCGPWFAGVLVRAEAVLANSRLGHLSTGSRLIGQAGQGPSRHQWASGPSTGGQQTTARHQSATRHRPVGLPVLRQSAHPFSGLTKSELLANSVQTKGSVSERRWLIALRQALWQFLALSFAPQPNWAVKPTPTSCACGCPPCSALRRGLPRALGPCPLATLSAKIPHPTKYRNENIINTENSGHMKATQAILCATSVAICFWGPAQAEDSQLLIFAAKMNASHEMAKICDKGDPGFLEKYEVNLRLLEERVTPLGINEALRLSLIHI